ncbi:hypothetical protein PHYSODRAFT_342609 [Phytophthora sojae]|uniref:Uncharacterized protein n=1 Tax=Phytophthora sojae (strain P6497) TaxID=1094619 RepID=G5AH35_PHYSP|nr:hypothetical protein PHYSODRAFT_342609 [Phytophthora sojae]EGZ05228.1 hypothetical protein PHYSODRAFT_342609 [Phytophthora sojae]|eukprot:XP_009539386.1 hypothetical protein PHYSODRAFT_342609 [Phytophthora sojae]
MPKVEPSSDMARAERPRSSVELLRTFSVVGKRGSEDLGKPTGNTVPWLPRLHNYYDLVGKRACLEKRYPILKAQRLEKARAYKREYDKLYHRARRDALNELDLRIITTAAGDVTTTVVESLVLSVPGDIELGGSTTAQSSPPRSARRRRVFSAPAPPTVIDITGEEDQDEDLSTCAIC